MTASDAGPPILTQSIWGQAGFYSTRRAGAHPTVQHHHVHGPVTTSILALLRVITSSASVAKSFVSSDAILVPLKLPQL